MKIRMLQNQKGSIDGIVVNEYEAGKTYIIPESLAKVFISLGVAEEDKAYDMAPERKEKEDLAKVFISLGVAEEDKAYDMAPERKEKEDKE